MTDPTILVQEGEVAPVGDDHTVQLIERAITEDNTMDLKIISPGWGSSGYYSEELLRRDGPKAWPAGTHQYLDHPTVSEEAERPERSVRDLAAVLVSDPVYEENGKLGPGLYAKSAVIPGYKDLLDALAPHIGVSIRARGSFTEGEAEGRTGRIIRELKSGESVDFVTKAGAGGKVLALMESFRPSTSTLPSTSDADAQTTEINETTNTILPTVPQEGDNMDEIQELQGKLAASEARVTELSTINETLTADNAALREARALSEARSFVAEELKKSDLPEITKTRLAETIVKTARLNAEGALDSAALAESITSAVTSEAEYVAQLTESGKVRDQGGKGVSSESGKLKESFKSRYLADGIPEDQAERMAAVAASGR